MPGKGQKAVTVPEKIYERVRREVEAGRERSVAKTFVKAVENYLGEKENLRHEFIEDISWLIKRIHEVRMNNIIHESFKHGENFKIGEFCIIKENCEVGHNVTIKDYVRLAEGTKIGNNCMIDSYVKSSGQNSIGNNVTIRYDSIIAREVTIEDDVFISPQVMTIYLTHKGEKKGGIIIGKGAFIGTNATIGAGVKIGSKTVIGAKALVTKDCLEPEIYIGIPARRRICP